MRMRPRRASGEHRATAPRPARQQRGPVSTARRRPQRPRPAPLPAARVVAAAPLRARSVSAHRAGSSVRSTTRRPAALPARCGRPLELRALRGPDPRAADTERLCPPLRRGSGLRENPVVFPGAVAALLCPRLLLSRAKSRLDRRWLCCAPCPLPPGRALCSCCCSYRL